MIQDDFHKTDKYSQEYGHDTIMTATGRMVAPLHLTEDDIDINDITHALSNICRYTGHTREFYSVAQHCYLVSTVVPQHLALAGLLHDAAETYFNDLARPVKHLPELEAYRKIEDASKFLIWQKFCKEVPSSPDDLEAILLADIRLLRTEQRDLMPWHNSYPEHELSTITIEGWPPAKAENAFRTRFLDLYQTQGKY